ncbi:MAG: NAD(P)-dependent oxidoreductase [Proteobacteria bacterium]|nr:NAD(P)-dependent oxidoreductase [Pseudomonadota bacterium]MCP4916419.1 NAD(P)-dependent oxidoreductase [Pseudomonadota bacterium]
MKVLLTGASGPLGRRVVLGLREQVELVVLVRPGEQVDLDGFERVDADPCTPDVWGPRVVGAEVLVHLSERCQASDAEILDVVLKGTQSVLHGFNAFGSPTRAVVLSTALIGPGSPDEPDVLPERYGSAWLAARCAAEARVTFWARRADVETCVVRAGHPFGAVGIDGPLTGWLEAAAASAESSGRLELDAADTALPFVHVDELARGIVARALGTSMPGERVLVGKLSRVDAVGMLATLGQVHRKLCQRTERDARIVTPRTSLGERLGGLVTSGRRLPRSPRYLRSAPLPVLDGAWTAEFGTRGLDQVVEALVGGAC